MNDFFSITETHDKSPIFKLIEQHFGSWKMGRCSSVSKDFSIILTNMMLPEEEETKKNIDEVSIFWRIQNRQKMKDLNQLDLFAFWKNGVAHISF